MGADPAIVELELALFQSHREVAHGREEERGPRLGGPDVARFLRHFRHQYDVGRRIDVGKSARVLVQLVSQHEYEVAAALHGLCSSLPLPDRTK
jgi:hypothetical protein